MGSEMCIRDRSSGEAGIYALSWLKTYLLQDPCYCGFLLENPLNASAYETNIECELLELTGSDNEELMLPYPNPSNEYIFISVDGLAEVSYKIYDMAGKCAKSGFVSQQSNNIPIDDLVNGPYVLKTGNQEYQFVKY